MDVDELLRRDGARWRRQVEPGDGVREGPVGPDAMSRRPEPSRRSRVFAVAASAAAILVLALGIVGVVRLTTGKTSGPAAGSHGLPLTPAEKDSLHPDLLPDLLRAMPTSPPAQIISDTSDPRLVSMPWRLVAVTGGGARLDVMFVVGDGVCTVARGFQVVEQPTSVELVAVSENVQTDEEACPALGKLGRVTITLSAALGSRALLHAPVGDAQSHLFPSR